MLFSSTSEQPNFFSVMDAKTLRLIRKLRRIKSIGDDKDNDDDDDENYDGYEYDDDEKYDDDVENGSGNPCKDSDGFVQTSLLLSHAKSIEVFMEPGNVSLMFCDYSSLCL